MKTIPFFICFLFTLALPMAVSGEKTPVVSGEESPEVSDEKSPAVSGEESPKVHVVVIKEGIFGFLPDTLTIQVGERVKWVLIG